MPSTEDLPAAFDSLASSFGAGGESAVKTDAFTLEQVRSFVAAHVTRLLDQNPGMLMSILYRIDVAEASVKHVFESEPPSAIVDRLTTLIIERQLEKVRHRRTYRERDDNPS